MRMMNIQGRAISCFAALALLSGSSVIANTLHVGGPPRHGHGRPPLQINLNPSVSTSYTPARIRHAYGVDQLTATGASQKIAIIDAYGNASIQSDLDTFCRQFGLSSTTVQILGNNTTVDSGWALETALDVEWAHAIAPGATIILSAARSSSLNDLLAAVDAAVSAGATVVSMSFGASEFSGMSYYDSHFNRAGVTFTASSGDNGAGVEWPAASPYVVAVGGTSLYLDSNNNRTSETAWSGSGGGVSSYYSIPAFQNGWQISNGRGVPDVSLVADPYTGVQVYDAANGGWFVVGGTSASAPQWAGLIALANQLRLQAGAALMSNTSSNLYALAQASTTPLYLVNANYYYDVSQGNNGAYNASPPYDFVTGLGSPMANQLVPALAPSSGASPPATGDFSLSASPGTANIKAGKSASYSVSISATGGFGGAVNLSVSGLPAGANASFSPVSIQASGSASLTVTTSGSTARGAFNLTITGSSSGTSGSVAHSTAVSLRIR